MATNLLIGDTVRVQVTFRDWEAVGEGELVDPVDVYVDVLRMENGVLVSTPETEQEVKVNNGIYHYDWTPTALGIHYIEFQGIFADGQTSKIREEFNVVATSPFAGGGSGETLEDDFIFTFATTTSPLYVDPESISDIYPDASAVELMESIHRFSLEVQKLFGNKEISFTAMEYIRAAALCDLSKIYDYGVNGDETSVSLGDLSFSTRNFPKMKVNRSNAANWCELAGALRQEMLRGAHGIGMRAVVAGSNHISPMPPRHVRSKEAPFQGGTRWPR